MSPYKELQNPEVDFGPGVWRVKNTSIGGVSTYNQFGKTTQYSLGSIHAPRQYLQHKNVGGWFRRYLARRKTFN